MHIVQTAESRYPVRFVSADNEVALERRAHFEIVAIPPHVFFKRPDPGAAGAFRIKQNRAAWTKCLAGIFQTFVRLPQINIERKSARGSHDQIVWLIDFHAQYFVHDAASTAVCMFVMSGDHANQFAFRDSRSVDQKSGSAMRHASSRSS